MLSRTVSAKLSGCNRNCEGSPSASVSVRVDQSEKSMHVNIFRDVILVTDISIHILRSLLVHVV